VDLHDGDEISSTQKRRWEKLGDVDVDAREAEIARRAKESRDSSGNAKMLSLMRYTHFDTSLVGQSTEDGEPSGVDEDVGLSGLDAVDVAVEDEALRSVLRKEGRRVGFVLVKRGHDHAVTETEVQVS
jgi:DNA repair and recombination protein RAD54B